MNQDKEKNCQIPSILDIFCTGTLGIFPVTSENQLIANLYHIQRVYQRYNTTYLLIVLERGVLLFSMFIDSRGFVHLTLDIPIKRRTNESFPHCIHNSWHFVPCRHAIYGLRFLHSRFLTLINWPLNKVRNESARI